MDNVFGTHIPDLPHVLFRWSGGGRTLPNDAEMWARSGAVSVGTSSRHVSYKTIEVAVFGVVLFGPFVS